MLSATILRPLTSARNYAKLSLPKKQIRRATSIGQSFRRNRGQKIIRTSTCHLGSYYSGLVRRTGRALVPPRRRLRSAAARPLGADRPPDGLFPPRALLGFKSRPSSLLKKAPPSGSLLVRIAGISTNREKKKKQIERLPQPAFPLPPYAFYSVSRE